MNKFQIYKIYQIFFLLGNYRCDQTSSVYLTLEIGVWHEKEKIVNPTFCSTNEFLECCLLKFSLQVKSEKILKLFQGHGKTRTTLFYTRSQQPTCPRAGSGQRSKIMWRLTCSY